MHKGSCLCGAVTFEADGNVVLTTGARISRRISTAHRGDYYDIADGLPKPEN